MRILVRAYPYWKNEFEKANDSKNEIIVSTGKVGVGKTTNQLIQLIHDYYSLQLLEDPKDYLKLIGDICLVVCSPNYYQSLSLYSCIKPIIMESDFIKDLKNKNKFKDYIKFIVLDYRDIKLIHSMNAVSMLIDNIIQETNESQHMILNAYGKLASRSKIGLGTTGHLLLNSSADNNSSFEFLNELPCKVYHTHTSTPALLTDL